MEETRNVAIIGDNPEALLLSVLYAEAGIPNYLGGPFLEEKRRRTNRSGIGEALWLLGIHIRTGKIRLVPDYYQLPVSQIRTLILANHASGANNGKNLEMISRNLASQITPGTVIAFAGLCSPNYTSTVLKSTIEKYAGLKTGTDFSLYYLPLFWKGEKVQEFREKPKVLAVLEDINASSFQRELLEVFPTLSIASTVELAEASGLFSAVSHELAHALRLELAKISERTGIDYDDVLRLCPDLQGILIEGHDFSPGRECIGTEIALSLGLRKEGPRLIRAAHSVNQDYQSQIVDMIRRALEHCGHPFRRSRIAVLGTYGLLKNSWSKSETPPLFHSLRKKGAVISLYTGENGTEPWSQMVQDHWQVENSLLKAVAKADCTLVALPKSRSSEVDADQLAAEMNRPGAVCDLTRVLEASNVERVGLFYTTIGRGNLNG